MQDVFFHPFFEVYTRDSFRATPREHWIDGWKIEYMAITRPATADRTPIVIVGGAFQNFNSYKYCVEQLLDAGPIILIDLPSMGNNQQITNVETGASAGILELPELAGFLGRWVQEVHLSKVSIMGMSLGSVVASHFAEQFPELIDRLVLMGVMQKTRQSWRMLLEESLHLMQEDRMEEFGQAVVLYLVNHARLTETQLSPTAKRLFFKQMAQFANTERLRYEINCKRLLRLQNVPIPQCPTLVAVGEFDSFTLPFENANFALQCPDMQFAVIKQADHLPQLERRRETMGLFATYLRNESLDGLAGIEPLTREQMRQLERRGERRVHLTEPVRHISHRHAAVAASHVTVVDISFFGVLLDAGSEQAAAALLAEPRDMALQLGEVDGEALVIECLIFEQHGQQVRALLKHGSFDNADHLHRLLASDAVLENLP
ncbi:MAG: alpha/beta hydrolase [Pseudomonadota bacterium]|nr:alpha/beta hydrolase [Pseudomonadota bacterium]